MLDRKASFAALLICFAIGSAPAKAAPPTPDEILARLTAARDATNLTDPSLKPWHLVATLDLLDPSGASTSHVTLEEWWASPTRWKRVDTFPNYTDTVIHDGDKYYRSKDAPPTPTPISLLATQIVDPLSRGFDFDHSQAVEQPRKFGSVALRCTMLQTPRSSDEPAAPLFLYATACFDDSNILRMDSFGGSAVLELNQTGLFQGKTVGLQLAVIEGPSLAAKASVTKLTTFIPSDTDFTPPADLQQSSGNAQPVAQVKSGVIAGLKIGGHPPQYPIYAKDHHISGSVLLRGVIGSDGHIISLQPVLAKDAILADAAMLAVRTWVYKPYLLNGVPTAVETTITINFNFG